MIRVPFRWRRTGVLALSLALVFGHAWVAVAAQEPPARGSVEAHPRAEETPAKAGGPSFEGDLEAWAHSYLDELADGSSGERGAWALDREVLRAAYFLSTEDRDWLDAARDSLALFEDRHGYAPGASPLLEAYRGALEVVRAKYARWPPNKLKHLSRGSEILDNLVQLHPDDLEIRYLRFASYAFLPSFLSRDEEVAEDAGVLVDGFSRPDSFLPPKVRSVLAVSVLAASELNETQRSTLTAVVAGYSLEQ